MKAMSSWATLKADLLASAKTHGEFRWYRRRRDQGKNFRWSCTFLVSQPSPQVDSLANSTSRAAAAGCAEVITIVTEITTAVAANPENSTVSTTFNFFLQDLNENIFLQITTLTSKITSISSSLVCSDDEKTSLMTSVGFMTLIDLLMTDTQFDHAT